MLLFTYLTFSTYSKILSHSIQILAPKPVCVKLFIHKSFPSNAKRVDAIISDNIDHFSYEFRKCSIYFCHFMSWIRTTSKLKLIYHSRKVAIMPNKIPREEHYCYSWKYMTKTKHWKTTGRNGQNIPPKQSRKYLVFIY